MSSSIKQALCVMGLFAAAAVASPAQAQMAEENGNHHNMPPATKEQLQQACTRLGNAIQKHPGMAALVHGHSKSPGYNPTHFKAMIQESCSLPEEKLALNPALNVEGMDEKTLEEMGGDACEQIHHLVHEDPGFFAVVHKTEATDQAFHYACMGADEPGAPKP